MLRKKKDCSSSSPKPLKNNGGLGRGRKGLLFSSPKLLNLWWLGTGSNRRHADFQSAALPTELPSRFGFYLKHPNK